MHNNNNNKCIKNKTKYIKTTKRTTNNKQTDRPDRQTNKCVVTKLHCRKLERQTQPNYNYSTVHMHVVCTTLYNSSKQWHTPALGPNTWTSSAPAPATTTTNSTRTSTNTNTSILYYTHTHTHAIISTQRTSTNTKHPTQRTRKKKKNKHPCQSNELRRPHTCHHGTSYVR